MYSSLVILVVTSDATSACSLNAMMPSDNPSPVWWLDQTAMSHWTAVIAAITWIRAGSEL